MADVVADADVSTDDFVLRLIAIEKESVEELRDVVSSIQNAAGFWFDAHHGLDTIDLLHLVKLVGQSFQVVGGPANKALVLTFERRFENLRPAQRQCRDGLEPVFVATAFEKAALYLSQLQRVLKSAFFGPRRQVHVFLDDFLVKVTVGKAIKGKGHQATIM